MKQHRIERILAEGVANQGSISVEHVVEALVEEIREDEEYWVPVKYDDDRSGFQILLVEDENGSTYLPAYTSQEEFEKSGEPEPCTLSLDMLVKCTAEEADLDGMVINPYGYAGKLNKGVLWYVIERKEPKNNDYIFYNRMINKALRFAIDWHSGQVRKGTTEGFITHPVEVMSIMNQMGMASIDPNLMIAGILHDTVEDTCATRDMIRWQFGRDVADLVDAHTEDKALSWEERKQLLMTELKTADIRIKILVMADVLANLRSLLRDCRRVGDQVWERFNAPREKQAWYYSKVQDALYDLQFYDNTAPLYWEMVRSYKDIFVEYRYDRENFRIFQISDDGETYVIARQNLQAKPWQEALPENTIRISRSYAERLEDNWGEHTSTERLLSDSEADVMIEPKGGRRNGQRQDWEIDF